MAKFDYDLGVIGGGAAGLTAAAGAARLGAKVLLIEAERTLGGDCLRFGCVPSKTLIHTANLRHQISKAWRFGLEPCNPPPADMAKVSSRIREVIAQVGKHDSVDRFVKLGVEVVFDQPVFADDHKVRLAKREVTAQKWIIATGSSPAVPAGFGLAEAGALTNREIFYITTLPKRLAVLGAGPVAVEMAQAFARLGSEVTLVQRGRGILKRADAELAALLKKRLESEGVKFAGHVTIAKIGRTQFPGGEVRLEGTRDGKPWKLACDEVLAALGRVPNVGGLGLDQAGVEFDGTGIKTDERLRSTRPHIFACGDVRGKYLFTHAAGYEAQVAVAGAVVRLPRKVDYRYFPWAVFTDPELAQIGMTEEEAKQAGHEVQTMASEFAANDRAVAEGADVGRVKLVLGAKGKVLGVSILGPRAGDLIGEWAVTLNAGVSMTKLASTVHPYPTLAEISKSLAGQVVAAKLFSPAVGKTLKFLFGLRGGGV